MPVDAPEQTTERSTADSPPGVGVFIQRIVRSLFNLLELEWEIIVLRLRAAIGVAIMRVFLAAAAFALAVAGIVFLEIAVFKALAAVCPVTGVCLIFAFGHLTVAAALLVWMLRAKAGRRSPGSAGDERPPSKEREQ